MDAGLQKLFAPPSSGVHSVAPTTATSFALGNINLYVDVQPTASWSALVEFRLTNYPHGADSPGSPTRPYQRTNNTIFDVTSPSGAWSTIRWGALLLERAYIQWQTSDLLAVRVGSFLTPFGIWNIDHGTPTLISLMLPQFQVTEMFPIHQVGLELLGSAHRGRWQLGYFLTLSNGRTPGHAPSEGRSGRCCGADHCSARSGTTLRPSVASVPSARRRRGPRSSCRP